MKLFDFFYIFIKSNLKIYFSLGFIFLILGFTISASYLYLETIKYVGIRDNLIQLEDSRKSIQVLNEWVPLNKDDLSNTSKKIIPSSMYGQLILQIIKQRMIVENFHF